jgi:hypothetical protein
MTRSSWSGISFDGKMAKRAAASASASAALPPPLPPLLLPPPPPPLPRRAVPRRVRAPPARHHQALVVPRRLRGQRHGRHDPGPPPPGARLRAVAPAGEGPRGLPRCTRRRVLGAFRVAWEVFGLMTLKHVYANQSTVELVIGVVGRIHGKKCAPDGIVAHVPLMLRICSRKREGGAGYLAAEEVAAEEHSAR